MRADEVVRGREAELGRKLELAGSESASVYAAAYECVRYPHYSLNCKAFVLNPKFANTCNHADFMVFNDISGEAPFPQKRILSVSVNEHVGSHTINYSC